MGDQLRTPGTRLGAFEIESTLGRGGMGAVYRVRSRLTGELRALKVILPQHLEDPAARARFLREMKIASAIDHPNVVRVYEPALDGDTLLLPMELVSGVTLREHLTNPLGGARALSPSEAVALLAPLCDGVAAVHARGVIHRDLKPANVMLVSSVDGALVPKVLDFGAARHEDGHDEHTAAGLALGTPPYMAPEQLRAAPDLDARADLYALGVIAYEMLVGQRPYGAASGTEILAKVFSREPFASVRERVPSVPAALDAVVLRALAFDRNDRFPSAHALRDALRDAVAAAIPTTPDPLSAELVSEAAVRPPPQQRAPRRLIAAAVALVGAAWFVTRRARPEAPRATPPPVAAVVAPTHVEPPLPVDASVAAPAVVQTLAAVQADAAVTPPPSASPTRPRHPRRVPVRL